MIASSSHILVPASSLGQVALAAVVAVIVLGHAHAAEAAGLRARSLQSLDGAILHAVIAKHHLGRLLALVLLLLGLRVLLLLLLLAAAAAQAQHQVQRRLFLNVIVAQRAPIFQLLSRKY